MITFRQKAGVATTETCIIVTFIPKQLVQNNANLIMAFKQNGTNMRHIYNDHVNTDMTFENFRRLCLLCLKEPYGFVVIDKNRNINSGSYRKGMVVYIRLN